MNSSLPTYSTIFKDNNGALILATSPCMTPQLRHFGIKYHLFKDNIHQSNGGVKITKVATGDKLADCMTKRLKVLFHHA